MANQQKNTETETAADPTDGKNAKVTRVVRYVGSADVREIDAAAWKNAKVEDQKKIVWDKSNDHSVPVDELNEAALAYVTDSDDGFVVEDVTN